MTSVIERFINLAVFFWVLNDLGDDSMEMPRRYSERDFLIGNRVTWTDLMREKDYRTARENFLEQLQHAKTEEEKNHIKEAINLINNEINQWEII